jgi:hypothetical protein
MGDSSASSTTAPSAVAGSAAGAGASRVRSPGPGVTHAGKRLPVAARNPRKKRPTKKQLHAALLRRHRKEYYRLFELQGGRCAICKRTREEAHPRDPTRRFDMDHNHAQMFIRGLLCRQCNRNLGGRMGPEPDAEWHDAAADYLKRGDHLNLH